MKTVPADGSGIHATPSTLPYGTLQSASQPRRYLSQTHLNHSLPARCSQLSPRHKHKHQQSTSFADTSARSSHHRHLRTALLPHAPLPQPPRPPYRHSGAAPILTTSQPVFRHRRQTVFHITPVAGRHHLRGGSQHSPATLRADRRAQDEHQ